MKLFFMGIVFSLVVVWSFWRGWVVAHLTIEDECDKLGKFYIRDRVFICKEENRDE